MRITGEVQIINHQLSSLNLSNKRSVCSSIAIGKQPGQLKNASGLYLHICTSQNKQGDKYKIFNNIKAVLTKFMNDGKFTIQLKQPELDFCIKTEATQAKAFLKVMKCALTSKNLDQLRFSNLNAIKENEIRRTVTKLVINQRKDYFSTHFPTTLKTFIGSSLKLTEITKILGLKNLSKLDLSNNNISEIPVELGNLTKLSSLDLSGNNIDQITSKFYSSNFNLTLCDLDLSFNRISNVSGFISNFKNLICLNLSNNCMTYLPTFIGKCAKLKNLDVSRNRLIYLPHTLTSLQLLKLDVSYNSWVLEPFPFKNDTVEYFPKLVELAAASCIKNNLEYNSEILPVSLCMYLTYHIQCGCGNVATYFRYSSIYCTTPCQILKADTVVSTVAMLPFRVFYCSLKCSRGLRHL